MTSREVGDPNLPGGEQFASPAPASLPTHALTSDVSNRPRGGGRRGVLLGVGVVIAILLAAAALVVAVTGPKQESQDKATASQPTSAAQDNSAADRTLCQAIEPLVKESSTEKNDFTGLGKSGSSERDAGVDAFTAKTKDWVTRAQKVLDNHLDPPRYLTRTLQRYIDDMRLISFTVRTGPSTDEDTALWTDSVAALAGPFEVCDTAGVQLW
jgi:hypothetical protein